jgi:hypothetical protein
MTLKEVCEKYEISENSLQTNFKRTQESLLKKKGVKIIKEGRGKNATYREEIVSDNRAETMFKALEPVRKAGVMKNDLSLSNFTFCVFMGVVTTPMLVFRGTHVDFLKYFEVPVSADAIEKLDRAIDDLTSDGIIGVIRDTSTDDEVLTLSLIRAAENDMKIGIDMLVNCRLLAAKYKKRDWIPIMKVWIGTELLSKQEYYTRDDLIEMTGSSKYLIDECTSILKDSNIFLTSKAYASMRKCLGVTADMNQEEFYTI